MVLGSGWIIKQTAAAPVSTPYPQLSPGEARRHVGRMRGASHDTKLRLTSYASDPLRSSPCSQLEPAADSNPGQHRMEPTIILSLTCRARRVPNALFTETARDHISCSFRPLSFGVFVMQQ